MIWDKKYKSYYAVHYSLPQEQNSKGTGGFICVFPGSVYYLVTTYWIFEIGSCENSTQFMETLLNQYIKPFKLGFQPILTDAQNE